MSDHRTEALSCVHHRLEDEHDPYAFCPPCIQERQRLRDDKDRS